MEGNCAKEPLEDAGDVGSDGGRDDAKATLMFMPDMVMR